jgi:hypothetical protein
MIPSYWRPLQGGGGGSSYIGVSGGATAPARGAAEGEDGWVVIADASAGRAVACVGDLTGELWRVVQSCGRR